MMRPFLLFVLVFTLFSCKKSDDGPLNCTEVYVYGLNITIRNVATNEVVTDGITVTAIDGNYSEELMNTSGFDVFFGAGERAGNYRITVSGIDYENFTSEVIEVGADECHVITESRDFQIQPN